MTTPFRTDQSSRPSRFGSAKIRSKCVKAEGKWIGLFRIKGKPRTALQASSIPAARPTAYAGATSARPLFGLRRRTTGAVPRENSTSETASVEPPPPPTMPRCAWVGSPPPAGCAHRRDCGHIPRSTPHPRGHSHKRGSRARCSGNTPTPPSLNEFLLRMRRFDPSTPPFPIASPNEKATGQPLCTPWRNLRARSERVTGRPPWGRHPIRLRSLQGYDQFETLADSSPCPST